MSKTRTIRVFISSTFRDFAEERNLLVRKVFPELRRKCRERQVELVDVDLRWGITEEEAKQGKVLPICLAEIDRSRPYFIGLLGERYGWVPEKDLYDSSLLLDQPWLEEHRGGKSVTELEIFHGVLNNPEMAGHAFFYFRDAAYSSQKGGDYLSDGEEERICLAALKGRILRSGFPLVENYPEPEALAERVRDDLWKLIDLKFPESEVPDSLARERMQHEAFASSRLGLYIGGECYLRALDAAISADPRKPVLVCGASGGGKSALLANWVQKYSLANPEAIVLTHFLATGADAASAVNMVIRLLREISRMTGEELVLDGDPRRALHMLEEWLEKAGNFAHEKGGVFVLLLDALDKMTEHRDLDWWPKRLPEGVALVASCLDGGVRDSVMPKMEWTELRVSPLQRSDCERFIREHLAKYRKSLTPQQTAMVLGHPLCGNPLFLRTLLEELRVFGVHEELNLRLKHYTASVTIDDLFEKVLERVESDNSPESVRAALEVLWAAKESFAEDELLAVSGLPPAFWAPIHIALDESLIGAGGRLAFGHDYLRKAVQERYLDSTEDRHRIQQCMGHFCAQAMAGGCKEISQYIRRHAVEHFLEAEDWDVAAGALSDLEFIEARAIAQELPAMLKDYAGAVKLLPEGVKQRQTEAARQAELDRYAGEMAEYAAAWSRIRDGSGEKEPTPPQPPPQVRLWTREEIAAERKCMTETPNRLDIVKAFRVFVATHAAPLQKYATSTAFAAHLARNEAPAGPVHDAGERRLEPLDGIKLLRQYRSGEIYNPLPACQAVLEDTYGGSCLVLSPDGRRVTSASLDNTIRVWDVESGECLKVLRVGVGGNLVLSVDERRVVSSSGHTIYFWDVESGECLKEFEHVTYHGNVRRAYYYDVTFFLLSADGRRVISVSERNMNTRMCVWDVESGECLKVLERNTGAIKSLVLTADGKRVISESFAPALGEWNQESKAFQEAERPSSSTLRVWDVESGECLKVLEGHTGAVKSMVITADGRRVISGGEDHTIRVWDLEGGACLKVLEGHTCGVNTIVLRADGRRVISGSMDNTIRVWDLESGECLKVLEGHTSWVNFLVLSADGRRVISGGDDHAIRVWDLESGECLKVLEGHVVQLFGYRGITSLVLSADGRRVISGSGDHTIRVWDLESGECLKVFERHTNGISSLVLSVDGRRVISRSYGDSRRMWDVESGRCMKVFEGEMNEIDSLVLSVDGRRVISRSYGDALRMWDVESGECLKVFEEYTVELTSGHKYGSNCLIQSADGRRVISGDRDDTIRVWNVESGECLKVLQGHSDGVKPIVQSADGRRVIWGSNGNGILGWDMESGEYRFFDGGHTATVKSLVLSKDEMRAISGSKDKTIRVWDVESGSCVGLLEEHAGAVESLVMSADGRLVVSGSGDHTLRVWDLSRYQKSRESLRVLKGHAGAVKSLVLTANEKCVISGSEDHTIRVWDLESGECLKVLEGHTGGVNPIVLSADGRSVISGSEDHTLRVWDSESGECLKILEGHTGGVESLVLAADGTRITSASWDNTIRVWDVESGECLEVLERHMEGVTSLVLTADGKRMVSGSWNHTLRFWDVESGECLKVIEGHTDGIRSLVMSADGRRIVSESPNHTMRVWDVENGECLKVLEGHMDVVKFLVISADGRSVISGHSDKIRVWDVESGECLKSLEVERITDELTDIFGLSYHTVYSFVVSADGRSVISGYSDKIRVWNVESGECLKVLEGHIAEVDFLVLSADGRRVISGSRDHTIRVWDVESGECLGVFSARGHSSMAFHSASGRLIVGFSDGRVEFYSLSNLNSAPYPDFPPIPHGMK